MPLHAYECQQCERAFETLVRAGSRQEPVSCPACDSPRVTRSLSIPAKPIASPAPMNCAGTGPPCGRNGCGRRGQ